MSPGLRLFTFLAFAAVLVAPLSAAAATSCCVCTRAAGSNACRESRSHDGGTAAVAASRTACDRVTRDLGGAYTCSFVADSGTGCATQPNCAAGVGTVAPLNEEASAATPEPSAPAAPTETNTNIPFTPAVPVLQLPIPSFAGFSALQVQTEGENRYVDIPFVAEYVLAIYRFSIGVIVTLTMVMIVIGGLRWVSAAGNASTIGAAKETIVRAVMGLLLALGSYTILYLISPDLVEFRSIRVNLVTRVDVEQELLTTTENTMDLDSAPGASGAGGGSGGGGGGGGGGYRRCDEGEPRTGSGCPVSLSSAVSCSSPSEPRTREFLAAIRSVCPGGEAGVVCAAEAAARCGVHMGSCLATARALARSTGATIRQRPGRSVNSNLLVPAQAAGNECRAGGGSEADCRRRAKDTAAAAIAAAYPGWPDVWIGELEPGDTFMVYNGRPGGRGQHSAIFLSRSGGYANVVQSAAAHYVSTGRICISRSCGGVLTRTYITE